MSGLVHHYGLIALFLIVMLESGGVPLPSPVEAYFEVANRCNSKCATCPLTFSPQEAAKQLSLEEFKRLVDQLPALRRVGE